jgi:hypothetical protein
MTTADTDTEIQPKFWIHASLVDGESTPRTPANCCAMAWASVSQQVAIGVVSRRPGDGLEEISPMGDVVLLKTPIDLGSDLGRAFIVDATRAGESLITDAELMEKYELSPADLQSIAADKAIGRAIRDERDRRVRNGTAARESAARYFVKGPGILDQIATAPDSNARHKIDAIRELRATASGGDDGPASQTEKFTIIINLGADAGDRIEHTFDVTPKAKQLEQESEPDGNEG